MCAKLARGCCGILCVALGINAAYGSAPAGVREALAEFETGATTSKPCAGDNGIGSRKEISRFQILPTVWRQYSSSRNYRDPETAWTVAQQVLREREQAFRRATGRDWDYVDIYVMWNAPGEYRRAKWNRARVSRVVMERAHRFANLLQDRSRLYAARN